MPETMTQTVYVRFSYDDKVSEEVPIHVGLDLSKNSNSKTVTQSFVKV
jgi:hypothetical protein